MQDQDQHDATGTGPGRHGPAGCHSPRDRSVPADERSRSEPTGPRVSPAAAAEGVLGLLNGPLVAGEVMARWTSAMALAVDTVAGTRVVGVLAAEASGVPNGLRLAARAATEPFAGYHAGDPVFVGAGQVCLQGWQIRPTRSYATAVGLIRPDEDRVRSLAALVSGHELGVPSSAVDAVRSALAGGHTAELRTSCSGLVGLGAGLTPGGDDVLAGLLVGLRAVGRAAPLQQIAAAIAPRMAARTTMFSADLLRLAAYGHASTETLGLLRELDRRRPDTDLAALERATASLLAVGHTSGADLATGLLIGLTGPSTRPTARARTRTGDRSAHTAHRISPAT